MKWHVKTRQGIENMPVEEVAKMAGEAPDYHRQDLFDAIKRGDYPQWTAYVQIMPEAEADTYAIHRFDLTKVWPYADYPLIEVGVLELRQTTSPR